MMNEVSTFAIQMWYKILLILSFLGISCFGYTQEPYFKNYRDINGLQTNCIFSVFQDSKGYIWLISDIGVSRFDGQTYIHYNTSHGLPDNEIYSMYEDHAGRIWFATANGKTGFYLDGKLYNETNLPILKKSTIKGSIYKIFQQDDNRIVCAGGLKTILIDMERQEVEERVTNERVAMVWKNPGNKIGGVHSTIGEVTSEGFKPISRPLSLLPNVLVVVQGDTLMITSGQDILVFGRYTGKLLHKTKVLEEEGSRFNSITLLNNKLWAGTDHGVVVLDYPSFKKEQRFLKNVAITFITHDRAGGLWVSSVNQGFFYTADPNIVYYTIPNVVLPYGAVLSLQKDYKDRVWMTLAGKGYAIFEHDTIRSKLDKLKDHFDRGIRFIRHLPDGTTLVMGLAGTLMIRAGNIQVLLQRASDVNVDQNGTYWTGMNGLFKINKDTVRYKTIPLPSFGDPKHDKLYGFSRATRLMGLRIKRIEFDNQKTVWVATPNGLFPIDINGKETCPLPYKIKDLDYDSISQTLWALTEDKGLYAIRNGHKIDSIMIRNRDGAVLCRDMFRESPNILWIASISGLFQVNSTIGALKLTSFTGAMGIGSDNIDAITMVGDKIMVNKGAGFLMFPKSTLMNPIAPPSVMIKSVKANNVLVPPDQYHQIQMKYQEGAIKIEFEALSYQEAPYIRYQYRLIGLDSCWYETANEAMEYSSLRPGSYTFEVRALNGLGDASNDIMRIQLKVKRPFWMQIWFYLLMGGLLAAMIVSYVRWRERKLRYRYEVERQLVEASREKSELQKKNTELKMLALRLQMNPHFIFNALNTIKGYYGQGKKLEANSFISKFARLLRLNLDYSNELIPLDQEIELLKIYLQLSQIRYPDKVNFQIEVDSKINPIEILIPSMLLQPFVENAVIHGLVSQKEQGDVFVNFQLCDDELKVTIHDTGVGRVVSSRKNLRDTHKPLATQITIDRLQLFRQKSDPKPLIFHDLYDDHGQSKGTKVVLHIPFQKKN